jgi:hypothetical protein
MFRSTNGVDTYSALTSGEEWEAAVRRRSQLRGADLSGVPRIPNIHQAVYAAASKPGALDMGSWHHECGTTHCRAGWVVTLAGKDGKEMERHLGTPAAAALIYMASDPTLKRVPNFYADNDAALKNMRVCAARERAAA